MAELQLALWQSPAALSGVKARLAWLADRLATDPPSDLLLLPELFISGYAVPAAHWRAAAEQADAALDNIATLARRHRTAIAFGYPEAHGEHLANSACLIDAEGERRLRHRKRVLPPGEERAVFHPGDEPPAVIALNGVSVSMLICYEVEFPEAVRACALTGAELVLVPTALGARWASVARQLVPTRAFENNCFVAYANHAGVEGELHYLGESCVVGPDGEDLARAGSETERLVARIDAQRMPALRMRLPYLDDLDAVAGA